MKTRIIIAIEVETSENCDLDVEACAVVDQILDEGLLQEAIEETAAIALNVTSALCRGTEAVT